MLLCTTMQDLIFLQAFSAQHDQNKIARMLKPLTDVWDELLTEWQYRWALSFPFLLIYLIAGSKTVIHFSRTCRTSMCRSFYGCISTVYTYPALQELQQFGRVWQACNNKKKITWAPVVV